MSKKKDPIVGVMEFFEGATLDAAQSALALAHAIVKKRTPPAEKKGKRGPRAVRTQPINQATPIVPPAPMQALVDPPPVPRESRRRRSTTPTPERESAATPKIDLPGLGPATIGD